jgi:DNA-binding LytR/AlgR family response regulator
LIRTLVVDDEQPARERLKQLLSAHADIEIVGEATTAWWRREDCRAHARPRAARYSDARRQRLDVAASLGRPRPAVIFCTAFDQYAVDAFELSALDYLLAGESRAPAAALDRVRAATAIRAATGPSNSCHRREDWRRRVFARPGIDTARAARWRLRVRGRRYASPHGD